LALKCPDCGGEMVRIKKGWECLNPDCDVIRVTFKRHYVVRRVVVIQGGKVK
jgi:hypothetical protein